MSRPQGQEIERTLVENDIRTLPDGFLAYHQSTLSPYRGMRGPVVETDEYSSAESCVKDLLRTFPKKTRL